MELPKTLIEWIEFMNGYRDPKSKAELKQIAIDAGEINKAMASSVGAGRQCGSRKEGGTYAACPLSPYGKPLEHFVTCKPLPIDPADYNLSNIGVKLVDLEEICLTCTGETAKKKAKDRFVTVCNVCNGTGKETVTHVFDIVGQEYYPNVADFLEEARRLGVSRRLELEEPRQYARLSTRSRLMLLHGKAIIKDSGHIIKAMNAKQKARLARAGCPKSLMGHLYDCAAIHWNVIEGGEPVAGEDRGFVTRHLTSSSYRGYKPPERVTPAYSLGIFAVFPLVKIEVIDPDGSYKSRVDRASNARLDVQAVEC